MTKELQDAIRHIKTRSDAWAVKVIEDALEQEPCEDAISREAVLDILENTDNGWIINEVEQLPSVQPSRNCEVCCDGSQTEKAKLCQKSYLAGMEHAKHQPRRKGHWIPVSERLPEDAYGCLVTVYDTDLRTQDEFENILPYTVGYDGKTWNNFCGEPIPFEVVAWMPLLEPYKDMRGDTDGRIED